MSKTMIEDGKPPKKILSKWENIVDTISELFNTPYVLITEINSPYLEVLIARNGISKNKIKINTSENQYSNKEIKNSSKILINDLLESKKDKEKFEFSPDLFFILNWPSGDIFGSVCICKKKENNVSSKTKKSIGHFIELIESHLKIIDKNLKIEEKNIKVEKKSEKLFDFFNQAPIGIFRTTFDDKIEYINSSMAKMLGASNVNQVLKAYQNLSKDFYVDSQRRAELLEKLKKENEVKNFEYEALKINGERFWVSMNAKVLAANSDSQAKIEGFVFDISERKEKEKQLRNQKEELAASNEQLSAYNEEIIAMNEELEQSFTEINLLNQRFVNMIELVSNMEDKTFMSEKEFFSDLLEHAIDIVPEADYAKMAIINENNNYKFVDAVGHDIELLKTLEIEKELFFNYYGKEIYNTQDHFIDLNKMETSQKEILKQALKPIKDSLYINITVDEQVVGRMALDIKDESSREFSDTTRKILESFSTLASAFFAFKRFENLQTNFTRELITSIIKIMEMYDLYTKGHSENVAEIASAIAKEMDLPKKTIKNTYWAGLVHDIGKLLIPLDIINKEGKLSEREYELIKKHPVWGSKALSNSESLKSISEYILYHHEKWDGSGYPEGISGDKIPIIAQILGVADAWDAMLSKRAYRDPLSMDEALKEVQQNKGSQFSPQVVKAFIQIIENNRIDSLRKDVLKHEINSVKNEKQTLGKKEYFKDLFEESNEGIVILDEDFNINRANDYFIEMFKHEKKSLIGKNIKEIVPAKKMLETESYINKLKQGRKIRSRTIRKKKGGAKIEVSIQAFPISLGENNAGYYVIYRDITELEDTKRKYENIKDRYKAIFENENTIMLIIDPDNGEIVDANPAAVNFYGWSKEKLKSMKIADLNVLNKEEVEKEMQEARKKNKNYFNFKHRIFNGEIKDVEVYSQPIPFAEKEYLYSIIHEAK